MFQLDFLSSDEEEILMKGVDEMAWDPSQSGRRKQVKCYFIFFHHQTFPSCYNSRTLALTFHLKFSPSLFSILILTLFLHLVQDHRDGLVSSSVISKVLVRILDVSI